MIVFLLILKHRTIVYITETFSKMASTFSQKWLTIFCQKAEKIVYSLPRNFAQISPGCAPNTYQWRRDFRLPMSESVMAICPIEKAIFAVNLPLKLFRVTVAKTDTGSVKTLHTLFDTYLDCMLTEFEANHIVRNVQNVEILTIKRVFKNHFWQIFDAIL